MRQEVVKYLGTAKTEEQLMALRRIGLAEIHASKQAVENERERLPPKIFAKVLLLEK